MPFCFFVSDLHGNEKRYLHLFEKIREETPEAVFFGGDILPSGLYSFTKDSLAPADFISNFLAQNLENLKSDLGSDYPEIFMIMGNDDAKVYEPLLIELDERGLISYIHGKKLAFKGMNIYGFTYVPPTPFTLKDWELYDVSRYTDPGCVPPEEGAFTVEVNKKHLPYRTIKKELDELAGDEDLSQSIFLFHSPPYQTVLDRAALDGKFFEHVPLDVHVGSIAIKQFIEMRQPFVSLHGHIHESYSLTGKWMEKIGNTIAMNAAHNGPELSLIRFDSAAPEKATRELL